jgi:hypothetical protein
MAKYTLAGGNPGIRQKPLAKVALVRKSKSLTEKHLRLESHFRGGQQSKLPEQFDGKASDHFYNGRVLSLASLWGLYRMRTT